MVSVSHGAGHAEEAVAMTEDPIANGQDPELAELLEAIVADQSAEIDEMTGMLAGT